MQYRGLIVGGTFDRENGKSSGLIDKLGRAIAVAAMAANDFTVEVQNGGNIDRLKELLDSTPDNDFVFWFANVSNDEEKIRDVKSVAPHTMLITSKRNDFIDDTCTKQKYDFEELLQRALAIKANLCFEFCRLPDGMFKMKVFDPLGCVWYEGTDIEDAAKAAIDRLMYLMSVTRKPSISTDDIPELAFNENDKKFLEFVRASADTFHKLMCLPPDVKRFVGNASLRFKQPTRCMNGFPAIRKNEYILISKRNVDKTGISEKDFVPCFLGDDGSVMFGGENKPSVDSPVQLRLFGKLKNIDYILHGHCYVENAPMTSLAIPCGAIEEVDEALRCIESNFGTFEGSFYAINLKGHGCLIMANASELDRMKSVKFCVRKLPEFM